MEHKLNILLVENDSSLGKFLTSSLSLNEYHVMKTTSMEVAIPVELITSGSTASDVKISKIEQIKES